MSAAFSRGWAKYNSLLVTNPLVTKGLTGGCLFAIGDLLAQKLDGTLSSPSGYNPYRTAVGFGWSSCIFTPFGHNWYSKFLPKHFPTSNLKDSTLKMLLDQTAFATGINALYLSYSTIAHGGTLDDAKVKVKKDLWSVLKANWYLWPAVQMFTFTLVPIPLQLPVMNIAVLFWSCYLAVIGNKERTQQVHNTMLTQSPLLASIPDDSFQDYKSFKKQTTTAQVPRPSH